MNKSEAIQYLQAQNGEIPDLALLHDENQEYPLWRLKIERVLEEVFGQDSWEYRTFHNAKSDIVPQRSWDTGSDNSRAIYQDELHSVNTALIAILQMDRELIAPKNNDPLHVDSESSPIDIFNCLQFHPKITEVSKSLFETNHYAQAISEACKALNNMVKAKMRTSSSGERLNAKALTDTGKSLDGSKLMSKVFGGNDPIIRLNALETDSDKDEQAGFTKLYMGAMEGIRNPKGHENTIQSDSYKALEYLSFISLLMKRLEESTTKD